MVVQSSGAVLQPIIVPSVDTAVGISLDVTAVLQSAHRCSLDGRTDTVTLHGGPYDGHRLQVRRGRLTLID